MSVALHADQWHRVAALRPRLVAQVRIHRHVIRGQVWHVIEDRSAARHQRLNAAAYRVVRLLDGRHSLAQIWQHVSAGATGRADGDQVSQDDIIQLVGQLNASDLIAIDAMPDAAELLTRHRRQQKQRRQQTTGNPLSIKLPLWDPDRFIRRLLAATPSLPAPLRWALWLAVVGGALVVAPAHWTDLTHNFGERLLAVDNLLIAAGVFPLLKLAHELAHGIGVVRRGGEVHEIGLMLLVFYPTPYVDASAASAFPSRFARMHVAAAGMMAELWIAAIAFFLWLAVEPGFVRSVLYNVVVLGSVTTVFFNANPLLRLDGYYILSDALGIANLGQRSTAFFQFLIGRFVLGARGETPPPATRFEQVCFVLYAPPAFVYRMLVTFGIAWFVATQYFFAGVLLAAWSIASGLLWPLGKGLVTLWRAPRFAARPWRAWGAVICAATLVVAMLAVVPMPRHLRAEGIVWLPEEALLRAGADGFVVATLVVDGAQVKAGDVAVVLHSAELASKVAEQESRLALSRAKYESALVAHPALAARYDEEVRSDESALARFRGDVAALELRARAAGTARLDRSQDLPGRFVHRGELLGYVLGPYVPRVRVALAQGEVELDPSTVRSVEMRIVGRPDIAFEGRLARATPKAGHELPSAALGSTGGGRFAVDPRDEHGSTALETVFQVDVEAVDAPSLGALGSRAYVSFEQPAEPIGRRWWRHVRRQFLSHLQV